MRLVLSRVRSLAILLASCHWACGQSPGTLQIDPNAQLGPPGIKVKPPSSVFNGELLLTFEADRSAMVYVSTNGMDPRTSSVGRIGGPSPFPLTIRATTTAKYFASADGKDGELKESTWFRAGGPKGTISGVVVVGGFAVGKEVGLFRNGVLVRMGTPTMPTEIPFSLSGLATGPHRLTAISDRNQDGEFMPFIDYQSATTTVDLDLGEPSRAGPENIRIYLGTSGSGLGTLRGTITLPRPPQFQNLQISVLDPSALMGGLNPMELLGRLMGGYRIFTDQSQTQYPYVITDLMPGRVIPMPTLFGLGGAGVALNLLASPQQVTIVADQEAMADYAFGPVTISGNLTLGRMSAPPGGVGLVVVAGRSVSPSEGLQALLMPALLTPDPLSGAAHAAYSGAACRARATFNLRIFTTANGANPLTEALSWALNPFAPGQPHATVITQLADATADITLP